MKRDVPLLIILSSPSGAGKTSLAREIMARNSKIGFSISATTRPPRPGEIDGKHYHFLSRDGFLAKVKGGEMLEYAEVFGNLYGTPRPPVEEMLKSGRDVIFDVDWQGGQQISNSELRQNVVSVFVLPPSIHELHERLEMRAQDSEDVIRNRMRKSRDEISHWDEYDYLIVNEDINQAADELGSILTAERLRKNRWQDVGKFIEELNREYMEMWDERSL